MFITILGYKDNIDFKNPDRLFTETTTFFVVPNFVFTGF